MRAAISVFCFFAFCAAFVFGQRSVVPLQQWTITNATFRVDSSVPATVLAAFVEKGVVKDPLFGVNLKNIDPTPFKTSWFYSTTFETPVISSNGRAILTFKGINYRMNVWLNNVQIGTMKETVGTFRYFEFDVTSILYARERKLMNALRIEMFPAKNEWWKPYNATDLGISFIDWNPPAPDENLGLWREVELDVYNGPVSIDYPSVHTQLADDAGSEAHLSVLVEVHNWVNATVTGTVKCELQTLGTLTQAVTLAPLERKQVNFLWTDAQYKSTLVVKNPRLWWPWQMGSAELYNAKFTFVAAATGVSDSMSTRFGIREMSDKLDERGHRLYSINHKPILIRGAGYSPVLFLESETNHTWQQQVFDYVRHMNLNTVRLEGKFPDDRFFDIADEMGILTIPGIACCDSWQHWGYWGSEQHAIAQESVRWQARRLRIHASVLSFWYSSDEVPYEQVEREYLAVFQEEQWPVPLLAAASERKSVVTGPTGVKMSGPYQWVPPYYWLNDTKRAGGAFSFFTEGGPGEAPTPYESLQAMMPADKLWPQNEVWDWHCGSPRGRYRNLSNFDPYLKARYGAPKSAVDYAKKAQAAAYESHRALFEGYSQNKYISTGVIQWMLNNAVPELIWHLFDYYFNPGGAYFGTQRACEPVHIQYSHNDGVISVVNSMYAATPNFEAQVDVFNIDGTKVWTETVSVQGVPSDGVVQISRWVPELLRRSGVSLTTTYFLRLQLLNAQTRVVVSRNVYWLSLKPDVLDWSHAHGVPCSAYADLTGLEALPSVELTTTHKTEQVSADRYRTTVHLSNPTQTVAFHVRLRLVQSGTARARPLVLPVEVLPVFWEDNYVTLFPGEEVTLAAEYTRQAAGGREPDLIVELWNNLN